MVEVERSVSHVEENDWRGALLLLQRIHVVVIKVTEKLQATKIILVMACAKRVHAGFSQLGCGHGRGVACACEVR